jgi:hypothetical protein
VEQKCLTEYDVLVGWDDGHFMISMHTASLMSSMMMMPNNQDHTLPLQLDHQMELEGMVVLRESLALGVLLILEVL